VKRRVLVDLNILLDVLLDRAPHAEASAALWAAVESGEAEGLLAAHSVTTLHYLASRSAGREFGDRCVADVLTVFSVAPVDRAVLAEALGMKWPDFEDAVCAASARSAGCHLIATRDPRGFKHSACPALAPGEALLAIRAPVASAP
jgi:predicted nucleic acid-binding protein